MINAHVRHGGHCNTQRSDPVIDTVLMQSNPQSGRHDGRPFRGSAWRCFSIHAYNTFMIVSIFFFSISFV